MFIRNGGVYSSVESIAFGIKPRLLYECIPLSFLIIAAGGKATDGEKNILDI